MVSDYSSILKIKYEEEEEVVPNAWSSELLVDLLSLIADKVRSLSLSEFIKFGSVCFEWRCFCIENYQHIKLLSNLPLLLIPFPSSSPSKNDNKNYTPSGPLSSSSSSSSTQDGKEEVCDNQNYIPSGPLSSSSSTQDEKMEEKEEVEEDYGKEEELGMEVEELEEEDHDDEEDDGDDEELEEEEEDDVEDDYNADDWGWIDEDYYNPRDIWLGQDYKQRHKSTRNFYSIYKEKMVYHDFPLPVPCYKNIRGSIHGWLVTVEECCSEEDGVDYYPVRLFNPFRTDNNNEIQLPPLSPLLPEDNPLRTSYYLKKAFLSTNPSSLSDPTTQLVVLGLNFHNKLAFCRPGDKAWTCVDTAEGYRPILDIICYQDQFYAIVQNGFVFAFTLFEPDQLHPSPALTVKLFPPEEDNYPHKGLIMRYLVESRGELFQVRREVACCSGYYKTSQFLVFKLDPKDPAKWVETKSLNDSMFFLGSSSTSISLSALDLPGCKPNSIYYTDDMELYWANCPSKGPCDIGVFNVEDGSFEPHDALELKTMPPPIWIQPML